MLARRYNRCSGSVATAQPGLADPRFFADGRPTAQALERKATALEHRRTANEGRRTQHESVSKHEVTEIHGQVIRRSVAQTFNMQTRSTARAGARPALFDTANHTKLWLATSP